MQLTDKNIEQLEALWQGILPDTDRMELENRLKNDPDFRKEADKMHLITEGLNVLKRRQMRDRLQLLEKTLPPIELPSSTNWLKIAAIILVVSALVAFVAVKYLGLWKEDKPKVSPAIVAYFDPYPALGVTRGTENGGIRENALQKYSIKRYREAIPLLQEAFELEKDSMLLFYKNIAFIGDGQSAKAISSFEQMRTSSYIPVDSIEWYLALAYIEANKIEQAKTLLQKIARANGRYQSKARELIETIK